MAKQSNAKAQPRRLGLSNQEVADARAISIAPSQSFADDAPDDMCIVNITELTDDKGNKRSYDKDVT